MDVELVIVEALGVICTTFKSRVDISEFSNYKTTRSAKLQLISRLHSLLWFLSSRNSE